MAAEITIRSFRNRVEDRGSQLCRYRSCDVGVMSEHNLLEQIKHYSENEIIFHATLFREFLLWLFGFV